MSSDEDDFWEDDFSEAEQQQRALYRDIQVGLNHLYDDDFYFRYANELAKIPKSAFYGYLSYFSPKKIAKIDLLTRDWAIHFSGFKYDYGDPEELVKAAILAKNFELLSFLYNEQATAKVFHDQNSPYYSIEINVGNLEREAGYSKDKKEVVWVAKKIKKQLRAAMPAKGKVKQVSAAIEIWKYPGLDEALMKIGVVPHYLQVSDQLRFQLRLLGTKMEEPERVAWKDAFSSKKNPTQYIFWTLYRNGNELALDGEAAYLLALFPQTISKSGNILPPEQLPFFVKKVKSRLDIPRPYFAVSKQTYNQPGRVYFNEPESLLFLSYKKVYYAHNVYEALLTLYQKVTTSKELVMVALKEITINHRYLIREYWGNYNKNLKYTLNEAYYSFGLSIEQPEKDWQNKLYLGNLVAENNDALEERVVQEALQAAGQELGYDLIFMQNFIGPLSVVSAIYDCRDNYEQYLYKM